jgi:hypothetical protein
MEIYFPFFRLGGDLPCRHGEAALFLVSLAQHTGVSSGSSTAEGFDTISSVSFGLFTPEGITVNKIQMHVAKGPGRHRQKVEVRWYMPVMDPNGNE